MTKVNSERTRYDTAGDAWIVDVDLANELHKRFSAPVNGNYRSYIPSWITFARKKGASPNGQGDVQIIDRNGNVYNPRAWDVLHFNPLDEKVKGSDVQWEKLFPVYHAAIDYDSKIKS